MENLKHTKEYVEKLAKDFYSPITTDLICSPKLVRDAYESGYMKAIEETAASELLEALMEAQKTISSYDNNFRDDKVNQLINNAINKATK